MKPQKNNTLELLKLFASYMVVFIHVSFYGKLGVVADALARFAVPFFFLVSGFYSYQITGEQIKKRIRNILTLLILATVCYILFEIAVSLKYNADGIAVLFGKYKNLKTYIDLLIFNVPVSSGHLWYLYAILYVYIIFYFVTILRIKEKTIFIISLLLLSVHIILGEVLSGFGIVLPIRLVRNFALMGIPFFALGLFVKKHEHKFRAIPNYMIVIFVAIGVLESVVSRYSFGKNELYLGSLFILFAIVCLSIKYAKAKYPAFLLGLEGCSTYIYIFHIMISTVMNILYGVVGIERYSSVVMINIYPLVVCTASTIFSYLFIKILKKVRKTNR